METTTETSIMQPTIEQSAVSMPDNETEEDISKRHRTEKKDLQANIQKIKKGINNCKKKKKEATAEISKLEEEMKHRHEEELKEFKENITVIEVVHKVSDLSVDETSEPVPVDNDTENDQQVNPKVSRAAKRRAKKAEAANIREAELKKEKHFQLLNSPRSIEMRLMAKLFEERKLKVKDIPADGNCMYAALSHQLNGNKSMENLRNLACDYMLTNESDFSPFLTDPDTGDMINSEGYKVYCDNVANTTTWGGQPELRALSQVLERKIQVLQAEGPDIILGEVFKGETLILAYYRHAFSLGEHYNSLVGENS